MERALYYKLASQESRERGDYEMAPILYAGPPWAHAVVWVAGRVIHYALRCKAVTERKYLRRVS